MCVIGWVFTLSVVIAFAYYGLTLLIGTTFVLVSALLPVVIIAALIVVVIKIISMSKQKKPKPQKNKSYSESIYKF
jgi:uncharacterized membrane protein